MWFTLWKYLNPLCSHFSFTQQKWSYSLYVQRAYWQLHMQPIAHCKAKTTTIPWNFPIMKVRSPEQQCRGRRAWMALQVCVFSLQAFRIQALMPASLSWWFSGKLCLCCVYIAIKFTLLWLSLSPPSLVINQDCTAVDSFLFSFPPFWSE